MSRIDEALARARRGDAAAVLPPEVGADLPAGVDFAPETNAVAAAAEQPTAAEQPAVADHPAASDSVAAAGLATPPVAPAAPAPTEGQEPAGGGIIETKADPAYLAAAEKLTIRATNAAAVEQYRRLAARLLLAQAETGIRRVMVTSALPGEGKTLTSANIALTLSESYKRKVLLIDADLRRPWVHELFQVPNVSGLNDGLQGDPTGRRIPVLSYTEHLSILTAGRPDSDPMSVLSGDRVRKVMEEAARWFDFVIIDTPPVALLPDAHLLSSVVDSVLLVIESGRTPLPAVKRAVDVVGKPRILGVVLNRATQGMQSDAYDYYGQYSHLPAVREEAR